MPGMTERKSPFRAEALKARATGEVGEPRGYMASGLYGVAAGLALLLAALVTVAATRSITMSDAAACGERPQRPGAASCPQKLVQPVRDVLFSRAAETRAP